MPTRILLLAVAAALGAPAQPLVTVSGRVVLGDGGPPPEPARIEHVCPGRTAVEAWTDSRGWFAFQVRGGTNSNIMDAAVWDRRQPAAGGDKLGSTCDVRATLPGFRPVRRALGVREWHDSPDVGVLVLYALAPAESPYVSVTTLEATPQARKLHEFALVAMSAKRPDARKAVRLLKQALEQSPRFAAAWTLLGKAHLELGDPGRSARLAWDQALDADSHYLPALLPLMRLEMESKSWEQTASLAERALRLAPLLIEPRYAHALSCLYLDRLEEAFASAQAVQESDEASSYPLTHHILGLIYADRGEFAAAAAEFEALIRLQPGTPLAAALEKRLREWADQGLLPKP